MTGRRKLSMDMPPSTLMFPEAGGDKSLPVALVTKKGGALRRQDELLVVSKLPTMRRSLVLGVGVFVALTALACGSPAQCLHDLPASCPSPVPSYSGSVSEIINQTCVVGCHTADGTAPDRVLNTYEDVYSERSAVLNQAYECFMPPAGSPPLTATQRDQLFGWLVCGAPNN